MIKNRTFTCHQCSGLALYKNWRMARKAGWLRSDEQTLFCPNCLTYPDVISKPEVTKARRAEDSRQEVDDVFVKYRFQLFSCLEVGEQLLKLCAEGKFAHSETDSLTIGFIQHQSKAVRSTLLKLQKNLDYHLMVFKHPPSEDWEVEYEDEDEDGLLGE